MRRLIFVAVIIGLSAVIATAHVSSIKGNYSKQTEFKLEKVNGSVYVLFGSGGNIGVSYGNSGLMIIDTQFAANVPRIKAELAKLGTDEPNFVFNTHYHGDHTGGNELFGINALIFAHENVKARLMSRTNRDGTPNPIAKSGLPFFTYKQGLSKYLNGEWVNAVHMPNGHTDGDTIIFFSGSNVVHLGDNFFAGRFPFVDLNSGGSVPGLVENIEKLLLMIPSDAKLIPGHGPVSTRADLKRYHSMLVDTTTIVRRNMQSGKSLEDIKSAGLPAKYESWSPEDAFINEARWIETIYNSYQMKMNE